MNHAMNSGFIACSTWYTNTVQDTITSTHTHTVTLKGCEMLELEHVMTFLSCTLIDSLDKPIKPLKHGCSRKEHLTQFLCPALSNLNEPKLW